MEPPSAQDPADAEKIMDKIAARLLVEMRQATARVRAQMQVPQPSGTTPPAVDTQPPDTTPGKLDAP